MQAFVLNITLQELLSTVFCCACSLRTFPEFCLHYVVIYLFHVNLGISSMFLCCYTKTYAKVFPSIPYYFNRSEGCPMQILNPFKNVVFEICESIVLLLRLMSAWKKLL